MSRVATVYANQFAPFYYNVTFLVKETGKVITKSFESEYQARMFTNKLKYSKRCTLVSCPLFK